MGKVYRVGSLFGIEYFDTAKEADRCKPGGEQPEEVIRLSASGECNRLNRLVDEIEERLHSVRYLLEELLTVCDPQTVANTEAGRRAGKWITDNPLPPADSADRDGQRSYGV